MAFPIRSIDFFLTRKSYRATLLKKNLEINSSYPKKKKKTQWKKILDREGNQFKYENGSPLICSRETTSTVVNNISSLL